MHNKRWIAGFLAFIMLFGVMFAPEVKAAEAEELLLSETTASEAEVPTEPEETSPPEVPTEPEETLPTEEPTEPEETVPEEEPTEPELSVTFTPEIPDDFVVPFASPPAQPYALRRSALPQVYDSRETGAITGVKDQTPWQLCWAFSALSVGESYLIKNGWDAGIDLSERHLGYYFHGDAVDPLGNAAGDGTYLEDSYLLSGNNNKFTTFALANWIGGAAESRYPYAEDISDPNRTNAMDDVVHLRNAFWINGQDRENIKSYVMKNGSVGISVYYLTEFYNPETAAYYNDQYTATNHAISIVGWDDGFSAANFKNTPEGDGAWLCKNSVGTQFGQEGYFWLSYYDMAISHANATAFVFEFESAQRYQNNYHHDGSFGTSVAVLPDGGAIANIYTVTNHEDNADEQIQAVSFAVADTDISYSIQIYRGLEVGDAPDGGIPALTTPQTGQTHLSGVYTVELDSAVQVCSGERFSVVVTLSSATGGDVRYFVDRSYANGSWIRFVSDTDSGESFAERNGEWIDLDDEEKCARIKAFTVKTDEASVSRLWFEQERVLLAPGQTYCQLPKWMPENAQAGVYFWRSDNESVAKVSEDGLVSAEALGQAVITAFTPGMRVSASYEVAVKPAIASINLMQIKEKMVVGEVFAPRAEILPASAASYYTLELESSDETVVRVTEGQLQAVSPGTATVIIRADTHRVSYTVTVTRSIQNAQVQTQTVIFDGPGAVTPVTVRLDGTELEENTDYTLTFSQNTKPGMGLVTVSGIGQYSGTVSGEYEIYIPIPDAPQAQNQSKGIRVTWEPVTGADGYHVYRCKGSGSWKKVKAISGSAGCSWLDTDATSAGAIYSYRVRAYVKSGKQVYTGKNSETVKQFRLTAAKISSIAQTDKGIKISWKKVTGANSYSLLRQTDGEAPEVIQTGSALNFTDTGVLAGGSKYTYTVVAEKRTADQIYQSGVSAAKTLYLPEAPVLQEPVNADGGIMLRWEPTALAGGYEIQRSSNGKSWTKVKTLTGGKNNCWTDTGCVSGKEYAYRILAFNRDGAATCKSQNPQPVSLLRLSTPKIGNVTRKDDGFGISWRAVPGAEEYWIRRSKDGDTETVITVLNGGIFPKFTDTDVEEGSLYTYRVVARKYDSGTALYSADSAARSARIPPAPELPSAENTGRGIRITWNRVENATGYEIYRRQGGAGWRRVGAVASGGTTFWTDTASMSGSVYSYRVLAVAAMDGNRFTGEMSAEVTACRLETPAIKNLKVTPQGITVSWKRIPGADGYRVYRSDNDATPVEVGFVSGGRTLRFDDDTATMAGVKYTYCVVAETMLDGSDCLSAVSAKETIMLPRW